MKIQTKTLLQAIDKFDLTEAKKNQLLNVIKIESINNKLRLSYYDYGYIDIVIDCETSDNFIIEVDALKLTKYIKTIKSDTIILLLDRDNLKINNYSIQINEELVMQNHCQHLQELDFDKILEINSNQFISMLNQVKEGMSTDKDRIKLNGVNINNKNNKLNLVSTSGHVLMIKTQDIDIKAIDEIIPSLEVKKIIKIFKNNQLLTISLCEKRIKIKSDNITFISCLIDDEYPGYVKILSVAGGEAIKINRKELLAITKEALGVTTDGHNSTIFDFQDNLLEVKVIEQDQIKYINKMAIDGLTNVKIGFNAKLMLKMLKSIEGDIIAFKIKDAVSAMSIESDNFTGLIMPIRI